MDLEQTKKLVTHFFETTDEGVAMTTFEPDEEAQSWLEENGYLLKIYGDVYCIARLPEEFPTEEKVKEIEAEMDERHRKCNQSLIKAQLETIRLARLGFGERIW